MLLPDTIFLDDDTFFFSPFPAQNRILFVRYSYKERSHHPKCCADEPKTAGWNQQQHHKEAKLAIAVAATFAQLNARIKRFPHHTAFSYEISYKKAVE